MKSDNEFLDGVYKKAEAFSSDKQNVVGFSTSKISLFKKYAGIAVAAVLVAVIAPSLYFGLNSGYEMIAPAQTATLKAAPIAIAMNAFSIEDMTAQSDVIVMANVKKIEKSVYESENDMNNNMTTDVLLKSKNVLKGDLSNNKFTVRVTGGYDEKTSNYIPYEAIFAKKEETLLFLTQSEENVYTLTASASGKYTKLTDQKDNEVFQDKYGNTITVQHLEEILQGNNLE